MCVCTKGWTLHHPCLWSTKYFEDAPFIPNRDNICSFYCYLKGVSKHVKALTISKQLKTTVLLNINKTSCKKGMSKNWGWLSTLLKDWTLLTSSSILFKSNNSFFYVWCFRVHVFDTAELFVSHLLMIKLWTPYLFSILYFPGALRGSTGAPPLYLQTVRSRSPVHTYRLSLWICLFMGTRDSLMVHPTVNWHCVLK